MSDAFRSRTQRPSPGTPQRRIRALVSRSLNDVSLREWLGENIHRHGRKFRPQDTLERAVGSRIDPEPYLKYLREKHGDAALA